MDIRNGGITGKLKRHFKAGISPLALGTQQTHRPVARWLFPLARLLLHKVFSLTCVLIHHASCSTRPSLQNQVKSLHTPAFYTCQEVQRNSGGILEPEGDPPPPEICEHGRQYLKTTFMRNNIRDKMKRLGDGRGPSLPRHEKPANTLTEGEIIPHTGGPKC